MKLISWNVNGLRAILKKGFIDFLKEQKPDILGLQEIKISKEVLDKLDLKWPGYSVYYNSALRPGYSGTAFLVKNSLSKSIEYISGINIEKFDNEGRVQIIELDRYFLLNIYFPNANSILSRLDFKVEFNNELLKYVKKLEKKKPVVISGDFNVAHRPIDLARPKENEGVAGYTKEERDFLNKLEKNNYIDSFRFINKDKVQYSWWSFRSFARERNVGWRIDYFWLSNNLKNKISAAYILDQVYGSDHAPVVLKLKK